MLSTSKSYATQSKELLSGLLVKLDKISLSVHRIPGSENKTGARKIGGAG